MTNAVKAVREHGMKKYGFGPEAMKSMRVCQLCGTIVYSKKNRCPECGTKLPKVTLYQIYADRHHKCEACGTIVANHAIYCPKCGQKLACAKDK